MKKSLVILLAIIACPLSLYCGRGKATQKKQIFNAESMSKINLMEEFHPLIQVVIKYLGLYEYRDVLSGIQTEEKHLLINILLSHAASQASSIEKALVAYMLVEDFGGNPNFIYEGKATPIDIARSYGHGNLANYLELKLQLGDCNNFQAQKTLKLALVGIKESDYTEAKKRLSLLEYEFIEGDDVIHYDPEYSNSLTKCIVKKFM